MIKLIFLSNLIFFSLMAQVRVLNVTRSYSPPDPQFLNNDSSHCAIVISGPNQDIEFSSLDSNYSSFFMTQNEIEREKERAVIIVDPGAAFLRISCKECLDNNFELEGLSPGGVLYLNLAITESQSMNHLREKMISELLSISAKAQQYRMMPKSIRGGGGTFEGFKIPKEFESTKFGIYTILGSPAADEIIFEGAAKIPGGDESKQMRNKSIVGPATITVKETQ